MDKRVNLCNPQESFSLSENSPRELQTGREAESVHALGYKVKTLLANIIGFSELILRKENRDVSSETIEYLNYIRETSLKLEGLLGEVLGKDGQDLEPRAAVPVSEIAAVCTKMIEEEARAAGVKLEVEEMPPEAGAVFVPKALLVETLTTLLRLVINNSAKGERVGLRCALTGKAALFIVRRTVSPDWQARKDECSRWEDAGSESEKLLTLVRELGRISGGRFWVEGTLGEVSSYCLLLPLVRGAGHEVGRG